MNRQRETIYGLRRQLMFEAEHREYLLGNTRVAKDLLHDLTASFLNLQVTPDQWDVDTYAAEIESIYALDPAKDAEVDFKRATYRVRGDAIEIYPAYERYAVRVELFGDDIERIELINPLSGELLAQEKQFFLFPAVHYVMPETELKSITAKIRQDLDARVLELRHQRKLWEAQRLIARTRYDLEMIDEVGYCNGVENYSRYFNGRLPGERPYTLMDYFDFAPPKDRPDLPPLTDPARFKDGIKPMRTAGLESPERGPERPNYRDWLLIIDESYVTLPQIRALYHGDRNRKTILVEHGFRLPAAMDNRPLRFEEFESMVPEVRCNRPSKHGAELAKHRGRVQATVTAARKG